MFMAEGHSISFPSCFWDWSWKTRVLPFFSKDTYGGFCHLTVTSLLIWMPLTEWYRFSLLIKYQIIVHALNVIYAFNAWWFQGEHKHLNAFMCLHPVLKRWKEKIMQSLRIYLFVQCIVKVRRAGNVRTKTYTICLWSSLLEAFEPFSWFSLPAVLRLTPLEWAIVEETVYTMHQLFLALQLLHWLELLRWSLTTILHLI